MSRPNTPENSDPKFEEQDQNRDVNALFSTFRLDQSAYRTFNRHRSAKPSDPPQLSSLEAAPQNRVHIGIFSPTGGSGKTTLAASLGSVYWRREKRVLLVDASPWPSLPFHYGATTSRPGIRSFFAPDGKDLPIRIFIPEPKQDVASATVHLADEIGADYVLFDLSGTSGEGLRGYLQHCQILIVPLLPDPSALRHVEITNALLAEIQTPPVKVTYLLNQMEDTPLAKKVQENLSRLLGDRLFSKAINRQPEIQEAYAEGIATALYAPTSQAANLFDELAQSLKVPKVAAAPRTQMRWSER
jgi:chromosome partitioning protein